MKATMATPTSRVPERAHRALRLRGLQGVRLLPTARLPIAAVAQGNWVAAALSARGRGYVWRALDRLDADRAAITTVTWTSIVRFSSSLKA
jgi:hypothetical protein